MKKQLLGSILFIVIQLVVSCTKCDDHKFRNKEYYMVVFGKTHENELRYIVLTGKDLNGKSVTFREVGLSDIYNNISLGDTLIKKRGSTVIVIAKKDKRAEFPSGCGDGYIKNPEWTLTKY